MLTIEKECFNTGMITKILDNEIPSLKNNTLLHNLVLNTLLEKLDTVQNTKNVLSCINEIL